MTASVPTVSGPTVACGGAACFEVATIRISVEGEQRALCPIHWATARANSPTRIRVLAEVDRPACFKIGCDLGAVSVMSDLDGRPLPVCERHLEDLSSVTPSPAELEALDQWEVQQ